jgi:hypothetical protein
MCDLCRRLDSGEQIPCDDCGNDTSPVTGIAEYYMVNHETWRDGTSLLNRHAKSLCVGCLEKRLGRVLTDHDFGGNGHFPVNSLFEHSPRLRDRMGWREYAKEAFLSLSMDQERKHEHHSS